MPLLDDDGPRDRQIKPSESAERIDRELGVIVGGTVDALTILRDHWRQTAAQVVGSAAFGFVVKAAEAKVPALRPAIAIGLGVSAATYGLDLAGRGRQMGQSLTEVWNNSDGETMRRSRANFADSGGRFLDDLVVNTSAGVLGATAAEKVLFGRESSYQRIATFEQPGLSHSPRNRLYRKDDPLAQIYQRSEESTVLLHTEKRGPGRFGKGSATAFFLSADGLMVTNRHVAMDRTTLCFFSGGEHFFAKRLASDPINDLAILQALPNGKETLNFKALKLAQREAEPGQTIVALSHHLSHERAALAPGVVKDVHQHPVPVDSRGVKLPDSNVDFDHKTRTFNVNADPAGIEYSPRAFGTYYSRPGSSGSPVMNQDGEVVGVIRGGSGRFRSIRATNSFIRLAPLQKLLASVPRTTD
jgi:S1-C subfamily serine protease